MSQRIIHILHLTDHWLRWVSLAREHQKLTVLSHGEIEGDSARSLGQWTESKMEQPGEIHLYDGRPMYFSFKLRLPREAKGQLDNVVKLKIRQELGLGEESVFWTVLSAEGKHAASGPLELTAIVARRESMQDLMDWHERHAFTSLWVGADLCAIPALMQAGRLASPMLVFNAHREGAILFVAEDGMLVTKHHAELSNGHHADPYWTQMAESNASRIHFGQPDTGALLKSNPTLAALPQIARSSVRGYADNPWITPLEQEIIDFDAVILGGIARLGSAHAAPRSLIAEGNARPVFASLNQKLSFGRLVSIAALLGLVLAISLLGISRQREHARQALVERADKLRAKTALLRAQSAVLEQIKAQRQPIMPVLEAIHQAAPAGIALQSLNLGEAGSIKLQGSAPNADATYLLTKALSESKMFENVQLQEVKQDERGQVSSFQLTARMKGRSRR